MKDKLKKLILIVVIICVSCSLMFDELKQFIRKKKISKNQTEKFM